MRKIANFAKFSEVSAIRYLRLSVLVVGWERTEAYRRLFVSQPWVTFRNLISKQIVDPRE